MTMYLSEYYENKMVVFFLMLDRFAATHVAYDLSVYLHLPAHETLFLLQEQLGEFFARADTPDTKSMPLEDYDVIVAYDESVLCGQRAPLRAKGVVFCKESGARALREDAQLSANVGFIEALEHMPMVQLFASGHLRAQAIINYNQIHNSILFAGKRILLPGFDALTQALSHVLKTFDAAPAIYTENIIEKLECLFGGHTPAEQEELAAFDIAIVDGEASEACLARIQPLLGESCRVYRVPREVFSSLPFESVDIIYSFILCMIERIVAPDDGAEDIGEMLAAIKYGAIQHRY